MTSNKTTLTAKEDPKYITKKDYLDNPVYIDKANLLDSLASFASTFNTSFTNKKFTRLRNQWRKGKELLVDNPYGANKYIIKLQSYKIKGEGNKVFFLKRAQDLLEKYIEKQVNDNHKKKSIINRYNFVIDTILSHLAFILENRNEDFSKDYELRNYITSTIKFLNEQKRVHDLPINTNLLSEINAKMEKLENKSDYKEG